MEAGRTSALLLFALRAAAFGGNIAVLTRISEWQRRG